MMRVWLIAGLLLAAGCGDNVKGSTPKDGGPGDGGSTALVGCLDSPEGAATAPTNRLPCELIPPGRSLE